MKIRNGFVSNSSSSSFIVAFKKLPKSIKEMQDMLFGDEPYYKNPYYYPEDKKYGSEPSWLAQEVAARVFRDVLEPIPIKELAIHFRGYIMDYDAPDRDSFSQNCDGHDQWWKAMEEYSIKAAESFVKNNPGAKFYEFEYSDNDGPFDTALEHGNLFERLPHVTISNH